MTNQNAPTAEELETFARLGTSTSFMYFRMMSDSLSKDTRRCMVACRDLRKVLYGGAQTLSSQDYADLDFWHRTYIRSFVTFVEGLLFVMRRIVVWAHERGELDLTPGEAVLLREHQYYVNVKRKRVEEKDRHNGLLENFVLVFEFFPRIFGSKLQVDYGNHGWELLQDVVNARNRLTHPKSTHDSLLQPALYTKISDSADWFLSCLQDLFGSIDAELLNRSEQGLLSHPEYKKFIAKWGSRNSLEA